MNIKFFAPKEGFSADEVRKNIHWLSADIECPFCKKWMAVAQTSYLGGPCVRCGRQTGLMKEEIYEPDEINFA